MRNANVIEPFRTLINSMSPESFKERDDYIRTCRRNYQHTYSYRVISDVPKALRGFCRAVGF